MKQAIVLCISLVLLLCQPLHAQEMRRMAAPSGEMVDSATVAKIINEGTKRSQVMDLLSWLTDVCGGRLTGSPGYKNATEWTSSTMRAWGLDNVHLEGWGPFGRGWSLKRYTASVLEPVAFPLLSYPKAWSKGTSGTTKADVVYLNTKTDSALETYHGKLKGKFVLLDEPRQIKAHFEPEGNRMADSTLLSLANADVRRSRRGRFEMSPEMVQRALLEYKKLEFCEEEGAAASLNISRIGDGGNIFVQGVNLPSHPDTPYANRPHPYDPKAPETLPQLVVAAEHYNRLVRMLSKGQAVKIEINLEVNFTKEDSVYNVIAEIPGTDLKDEVVMIGGHLDSWHGGTGATDDGTGVVTCMEAMRILKTLNLKPRRTIRIGLWSAEEQGLLGSRAYVRQHFGKREMPPGSAGPVITLLPEAEKFSAYFNHDNGTGKIRGVYMQGNEAVRPIFRAWLAPFKGMGASTLSLANTGGTDHLSFDDIGLPGFQFIQDEIEYDTRTHHSIMDVYERVQEEDLKQAAVIMATFAYQAAMRDEKLPRKSR